MVTLFSLASVNKIDMIFSKCYRCAPTMEDLDSMTLTQLKAYAKENNISITGLSKKEDILTTIKDASEEDTVECVTAEEFSEKMTKMEQRIAALEKKLLEMTRNQRKRRLRQLRFDSENFGIDTIVDPINLSLDDLKKKNYANVSFLEEDYPGDSLPHGTDLNRLDLDEFTKVASALDEELNEIEEFIKEFYDFKMPDELFDGAISLSNFLELDLSDVSLEYDPDGATLKLGKNVVKLGKDHKKVQLALEKYIVRFVFYNGQWLISADKIEKSKRL